MALNPLEVVAGMKVVYVKSVGKVSPEVPLIKALYGLSKEPEVGQIYTVESVHIHPDGRNIGIALIELYPQELIHNIKSFDKLVEKKTDISTFTEILTNIPDDVRKQLENEKG